jgi:GntR family transcriptional regulator / MocR family aminotransferase
LYDVLSDLILNGTLPSGHRLPSSRVLADEIEVSRTTTVTVYDRLISEGLLVSKIGSGSFVSSVLNQRLLALDSVKPKNRESETVSPKLSKAFNKMSKWLPIPVEFSDSQAFSTSIPAVDAFPWNLWARLMARHSRKQELARYDSSKGYLPLRRAIAAHLRTERGLVCSPEQVFVTNGTQQAFSFLGEILIDPGDTIWFENPGSRVARTGLSARAARLVAVSVDADGLNVDEANTLAPDFRLVSVTPSHQQPRGSIMSLERRIALLNAADRANAWIIEDDFDGEFFYAKQPLPTLFSVARSQRVIYVGTFSKSMFPSLRLGYFVAPENLVEPLDRSINSYLPAVPSQNQAALAEFIEQGHFSAHIRKVKNLYQERYQALASAIHRHLDEYLELVPTETGFHALTLFKGDFDETEVTEEAGRSNLLVRPLMNYCIKPVASAKGIVLGYGCVTPTQIEQAVIRLQTVFNKIKHS